MTFVQGLFVFLGVILAGLGIWIWQKGEREEKPADAKTPLVSVSGPPGLILALAGLGLVVFPFTPWFPVHDAAASGDTLANGNGGAPTPGASPTDTGAATASDPSGSRTLKPGVSESLEFAALSVDIRDNSGHPNYLFRQNVDPASAPPPLNSDFRIRQDFVEWATENDGRLFSDQNVELEIRGRDEKAVNIDVRVVARRDGLPDSGWVNGWSGCGAATPERNLVAVLTPDGVDQQVLVDSQPFDDALFVTQSEPEVFVVDVAALDGVYDWGIEISYASEEGDGVEVIDSIHGYDLTLVGGGDQVLYTVSDPSPATLQEDDEATRTARQDGVVC